MSDPKASAGVPADVRPPGPSDPPTVQPLRSAKIQSRHLEKLAIIYVRQSHPQQVIDHRESRERQYNLVGLAVSLGWPRERVLTIDDDQGVTAAIPGYRGGYGRVMTEITLDHVGVIVGGEMSRLARCGVDWHQLLEASARFGVVLADPDGVYDPRDSNDRLLLGLKGNMSEYELVIMRNRLYGALLNKAERGELFTGAPAGYVRQSDNQVVKDPDEQVQSIIALIFTKFEELGTVYALHRYLLGHEIRIGGRARCGPGRGQLEWRRPTAGTLCQMLRHPMYAGSYAYGCRAADPRHRSRKNRATSRRMPMDEWKVLKHGVLPAYISWEQYLANQQRLRANRPGPQSAGAARSGSALLSGLVQCGTCGRRLSTGYSQRGRGRYVCMRHVVHATPQTCHGVMAGPVDALVSEQVVRALGPAALELSLRAVEDVQQERDRVSRNWQQQLERARYDADRARRQYDAVDPENRLVSRKLEQGWEEALRRQRDLEEEYDRYCRSQPTRLSAEERQRIESLSADVGRLWGAEGTTAADRKEMIRCVVERVVVQVRPDSQQVRLAIHWKGGCKTEHETVRPISDYVQMDSYQVLQERLRQLREDGRTAPQIAEQLNAEGFRTPRQTGRFTAATVRQFLSRLKMTKTGKIVSLNVGQDEWSLADLAREVGVRSSKLRAWAVRGWLHSRRTAGRRWVMWADRDEVTRLKKLNASSARGVESYPKELTTPKKLSQDDIQNNK